MNLADNYSQYINLMIEIKPNISHRSSCPYCQLSLKPDKVIWQGMHTCVKSTCIQCNVDIIDDLKVGHAVNYSYQLDVLQGKFWGRKNEEDWLGRPLLESLQNPKYEEVKISKEVFKKCSRVVILNCIDFLYGHCLLKLLNAQRHLEYNADYGLIIIIQNFLRWMVPDGIAELWIVDIPLKNAHFYYPNLDRFIWEESNRFDEIYVSKADSHPSQFSVTEFTRVPTYKFNRENFRITFIWREDRIWCNLLLRRAFRKLGLYDFALLLQNWRVRSLFNQLRLKIPSARFAIAGLGKKTAFPAWIEDLRVDKFDEKVERELCQLYSNSTLVIGVHGSSMLLPSGHAGMTIDLMLNGKEERWHNFAQDILYQETDPRLAAFRYRYVSFETSTAECARIASSMILDYWEFSTNMTVKR